MKSQIVSNQFRVLARDIATALDVLPVKQISVGIEMQELVELIAKQAQKAKFELDPDDELAAKQVATVLEQFENRFQPDSSILKQQLSAENKCSEELMKCLNPEDFRCPISLELMTDPVTVSTGQTYDRSSIQKWLQSGNTICPKTGKRLANTELVPNTALRKLIYQFCWSHGISLAKSRTTSTSHSMTRAVVAGSASAAEAMKFIAEFLANRLAFGSDDEKNKAAYEIRLLGKSSMFNSACLIKAGAVSPLLSLLTSTTNPITQENAIAALLKLSKHNRGKRVIVENGGLGVVIGVIEKGLKVECRQIAAAVIFYLASIEEYRKLIGETVGAIPKLVELIRIGTPCGKKNSLVAIFGLILCKENHKRVLEANAVPPIVDLLCSSDGSDLVTDSLAVLASLSESIEGAVAIKESSAMHLVMGILQTSTSRAGKEYCVSILLSMSTHLGTEVITVLANECALTTSLYSLLIDGTSPAKRKARSLLKIIHRFHETYSSGFICSDAAEDQFVHAW
ncbi:Armadillo [Dillenia turbinata]|uniref:RING-type E3 ubiquitin transferase n=1 Tax=Dillenia turbinata TaxID=194707 RepID=A0AAN8YZC8_9MAGN